ncbi:DUF5668 domain-containing protein [Salipaludibacillus sp. CUR1]|uniref:LiaI-LiaF-like domain-containing protein n=1 Tax=Salipaludibacillus sp. CUR1 TaxID=2820003 RepID=UPI001E2A5BB3|nr:DUF5668 domain-containing protein [Salipaludibacillus sp. CUR1]MCE7793468.1 DUF5668 domain-containing protein [Salipaludibacillus sp. CUR1]
MKSNQALPGIILIAAGIFFLTRQFNFTFPYGDLLFQWPSILIIIGFVLSWQGFSNRDDHKMFSGIVLLGLGILFHGIYTFNYWTYEWPYFTLIIALAFLLKYAVNKRDGAGPGFILLIISAAALFYSTITEWAYSLHSSVETIWPGLLILIGVYLLFFRKR